MADALIARLNNVKLTATSKHSSSPRVTDGHVVSFEYPAMDLLPYGVSIYLSDPTHTRQRREPDINSFHPDLGTEYFVNLTSTAPGSSAQSSRHSNTDKLLAAINGLRDTVGFSSLRIVTFTTPPNFKVTYRFQLKSNLAGPFGFSWSVQNFELDEAGWRALYPYQHNEPWMSLLFDLVDRASERAYFEVRTRLLQQYEEQHYEIVEGGRLRERWFSKPARTASQLLMSNLTPWDSTDQAVMHGLGDGLMQVVLPCRHYIQTRKIAITSLGLEGCLTLQCPTCSERVMQRKNDDELNLGEEVHRADEYRRKSVLWRGLDNETCITITEPYAFNTRIVLEGLDLALYSFTGPKLIQPEALCPTVMYHQLITMIMQHFGTVYGRSSENFVHSPSQLFDALYYAAMGTDLDYSVGVADALMPKGFDEFLFRWLTRAVNWLVERRCYTIGEEGHDGVHEHDSPGDVGWCFQADWGRDVYSDRMQGDDASMEEVRRKMEQTGI